MAELIDEVHVDQPEPSAPGPDAPTVDETGDAEVPFPSIGDRLGGVWTRFSQTIEDDPGRIFEGLVSFLVVVLGTWLVLATLGPKNLFSDTTPTGGDMGSHVWGPRYLIDHLLPNFRLSGWTPDWYSGFPAYQFYMVVPSLLVVALHVGLPWYLAIPVVGLAVGIGLAGWMRERLYRYRWLLMAVAGAMIVLSVGVSYNRSFKLVTALGLLGLPVACWILAKASDLPFPIPPLASAAGVVFIFNREPLYNNTGNIIGGNFQSTMAGEFSFSISLTLAVLYLAVAVRGLKTGRYRALAAVLFALAGLCHLIPAFFVLACTAALFVVHPDKARFRWLVTMVPVAGLLTAFWVLPFVFRSDYVNDMGWERLPLPTGEQTSVWYYLLPDGLRYLFVMAAVGSIVSLVRRYSVGLVLTIAWAGVWVAFASLPQMRLWNARLLPFMYLSVALLAAIGVGEFLRVIAVAASGDLKKPFRFVSVGGAVVCIFGALLYAALPINGLFPKSVKRVTVTMKEGDTSVSKTKSSWFIFSTTSSNPATGWSGTDYSGLESKTAVPAGCDVPGSTVACTSGGWNEYRNVIQTMAGIGQDPRYGCGRAFWEYDGDRLGGYGTPMALMMLPYFTGSCIGSQEGLYFESSTTVPYHFMMQAELSAKPSQPQRDLPYPGFDMDAGVRHLQMLGVRYYMASTTTAVDQASRHPDLKPIAVSGPWHIYEVQDAATVSPMTYEPVIAKGMGESQHEWLPTASSWFGESDQLDVPLAVDGPEDWRTVDVDPVPTEWRNVVRYTRDQLGETGAIDRVPTLPRTILPKVKVSNTEMGIDTISFDVDKVGVPVLVKTSYFPNWEVSGAKGPYRVSPNLMVVIPTSKHVSMDYGRTPIDLIAPFLTLLGLVGVVLLARRPQIEVPPEKPTRLSVWIDGLLTIEPVVPQPVGPDGQPLGPPGQFGSLPPPPVLPAPPDPAPAAPAAPVAPIAPAAAGDALADPFGDEDIWSRDASDEAGPSDDSPDEPSTSPGDAPEGG